MAKPIFLDNRAWPNIVAFATDIVNEAVSEVLTISRKAEEDYRRGVIKK